MLAPVGMKVETSLHRNLHVYIAGYIYKFLRLFNKNIDLIQVVFFIPVAISILSIIALFLFCRSLTGNSIAGFFASLALGIAPIYLMRSMAGWFDTDPYVILFSALIIWGYYSLVKDESASLKSIFTVFLVSLCMGFFALTWDGWWYIFDIVILSTLYYLANLYLLKNEFGLRKLIFKVNFSLGLFFILSLIFVALLAGTKTAAHFITGPIDLISAYKGSFWPNTFLTVAELGKGNPMEILHDIGGAFVLFFAVAYLLIVLMDKKSTGFIAKGFLGMLFSIWIIILYFVSLKARRFSLLLAVPTSICLGLFLEKSYFYLKEIISKKVKASFKTDFLFLGVSLILLFIFLNNARFTAGFVPLMDKEWYEVLNKIKKDTPKEAIINTWWDYGHWFKAISDRRVIFDGATQNTPMAYWMGRVFISNDEKEAVGILRMLNSGSNKAFEKLKTSGFDELDSFNILNALLKFDKLQADNFLKKYIPDIKIRNEVIKCMYNPLPAYFIIESSLISKIRPISFLGGWDFGKADIYKNYKRLKKDAFLAYVVKRHGYSKEKADEVYNTLKLFTKEDSLDWISPFSAFYSESKNFSKEANVLYFDNGFTMDLGNYSVHSYSPVAGKWIMPKSVFHFKGPRDDIEEVKIEKSDSEYSVFLAGEDNNYKIIALDEGLAKSMLARLYYFKGKGLKYFKLFLEKELKDNRGKILVYKISWDGQ